MKKLFVILFSLALLATVPLMAQAPSPAPIAALPAFEVYLGGGQVATATAGNAITYTTKFETNVFAGFRWFPMEKFAIDTNFTHDSAKIGLWLTKHGFLEKQPIEAYQYGALAVSAEYWLVRNAKGGVFGFVGPNYFLGTGSTANKLGLSAGFGAQYALGNFFLETKLEYWHVQDFPFNGMVANTEVGRLAFGYKF
jgi:opacity protein-like surface antigen